jgi:hypothetical protein
MESPLKRENYVFCTVEVVDRQVQVLRDQHWSDSTSDLLRNSSLVPYLNPRVSQALLFASVPLMYGNRELLDASGE